MIRMIACDLDGTLIDESQTIRPQASAWLKRLSLSGVMVVLATGRSWRTALAFQRQLGIKGPLIAHDGGYLFDTRRQVELYRRGIPLDQARGMIDWCTDHRVMVRSYMGYRKPVIFNFFDDVHQIYYRRPEDTLLTDNRAELKADPLELYMFMEQDAAVARFCEEFEGKDEGYCVHVFPQSGATKVTVNPPNVDKVDALTVLCRLMGFDTADVMAFGDGLNDRQMLKWVGVGVAMGHGVPDNFSHAAFVTTDAKDEDPVVQGIRWAMGEGLLQADSGYAG
jgi:Cof subfamily protein (haloacid dehalogenase superfamily)